MADGKGQKLTYWALRLYGVVQGVGFRPFVAKTAARFGIAGTVQNLGGCVDIVACGEAAALSAFKSALFSQKPPHAQIVYAERRELPPRQFDSFSILPSESSSGLVFLPADLPTCEACLAEMANTSDRRFLHPFISCMSCGPRYSVIERVPYDRDTTTMRDFAMCPKCEAEYTDREDRRYHAQTVGCHDCGPVLMYRDAAGNISRRDKAFDLAVSALKNGGIVAVKGIGGYHLACSPFDERTVRNLRLLKRREHKPFAVLFETVDDIRQYCEVSSAERELLTSPARPIVLLHGDTKRFASAVCNKSRLIGAFVAYTPLQAMLLRAAGPLVMTSANVSEEPIVKDDEAMFAWQNPLLSGVLYNDRRISIRLDDSVCRVMGNRTFTIRRSRGYAPLPVVMKGNLRKDVCVFAAGADLKSAFCFAKAPFATLCEHVGDLASEANAVAYAQNYDRIRELFLFAPALAACDAHPAYESMRFARNLGLPVLDVQHHHAHIASVIAEHGLWGNVIGVAFDGTGYGADGAVWGGEFLVCSGAHYRRAGHLKYTQMPNGDEGMKDAAKAALCHLYAAGLETEIEDDRWPILKAAIDAGVNTHHNSSVGRLFDAVSAYLGICSYNRFEAECAQALENLAAEALGSGIDPVPMTFGITAKDDMLIVDASAVWQTLAKNRRSDVRALSLGFHAALAEAAVEVCKRIREETDSKTVALSGGVFQNEVLFTLMTKALEQDGFIVYTNRAVPVNDGGIALGQAYVALCEEEE